MHRYFGAHKPTIDRIMINFHTTSSSSSQAEWRANPTYIYNNIISMFDFEKVEEYYGPVHVLVGGKSNRFKHQHFVH